MFETRPTFITNDMQYLISTKEVAIVPTISSTSFHF